MIMMKKYFMLFNKKVNNYMRTKLSKPNYLIFAQYLYPILFFKLPCFKIKFDILSNEMIKMRDLCGEYYFYSAYRATRYTLRNNYGSENGMGFKGAGLNLARNYQIIDINIKENDIVVEVGSNIGELTSYFLNRTSRVYCFEIDPIALECLKLNCKKAEIIEMAAYHSTGMTTVYLESAGASTSLLESGNYSKSMEIPTIRLDEFMLKKNIAKIKLLKVEAEGAEPEVLKGLGKKIRDIEYISIDAGPERYGKPTVNEVEDILKANGFKVFQHGYYVIGKNDRIF